MDENLIELLIWIIAYELSNRGAKVEHRHIFSRLYEKISKAYQLTEKNQDLMNITFNSHIELGNKMLNFYCAHFCESLNNQELTLKFIEQLQNGRYINEFQELKKISQGTFGFVFHVKSKYDHQEYAIKKVDYNENLCESFAQRILREIRLWPKLIQSHYFVHYVTSWAEKNTQEYEMRNDDWDVNAESYSERKRAYERVDDECEDENTNRPMIGRMLYIQMELCKMTLKEAITNINLELGQKIGEPITVVGAYIATQFFYEIVSGVDYLHSQSPPIIHRDLKPGNIFITDGRDGNFIKIGDFGIAVTHGSDNNVSSEDVSIKDYIKHTQHRGTIGYMAPEVKELSKYNEKCDIYSLGCIALDLLCINKDVVNDWDKLTRSLLNSNKSIEKFEYVDNLLWIIQSCLLLDTSRRPTCSSIINKNNWLVTIKDISEWPLITSLYKIAMKENTLKNSNMNPLSDYIVNMKLMKNREKEISKHPWVENDRKLMINSIELCKSSYKIFLGSYKDIKYLDNDAKDIGELVKQLYFVYASPGSISKFIIRHLHKRSKSWDCSIVSIVNSSPIKIIVWASLEYFYTVFPWSSSKFSLLIFYNYNIDEKLEALMSQEQYVIPIINEFNDEKTQLLITMVRDTRYTNSKELNELLRAMIGDQNAFSYINQDLELFLVYEENYSVEDYGEISTIIKVKCKYAAIIDGLSFALFTYEEMDHIEKMDNNRELTYKFDKCHNSEDVTCVSNLYIQGLRPPPSSSLVGSRISFV